MTAPTPEQRATWRELYSDKDYVAEQVDADRILALLDALDAAEAALAEAWDQGYGAGVSDEQADDERTDNPYRPAPPSSSRYVEPEGEQ